MTDKSFFGIKFWNLKILQCWVLQIYFLLYPMLKYVWNMGRFCKVHLRIKFGSILLCSLLDFFGKVFLNLLHWNLNDVTPVFVNPFMRSVLPLLTWVSRPLTSIRISDTLNLQVCFGDISEGEGNVTEKELKDKYGEPRVVFQRCDVTNDADVKSKLHSTRKS